MPTKVTYGKRKKSILSLLPVLRDDGNSSQSPNSKAEKRVSATLSMSAFHGKHNNDSSRQSILAFDESTEETTSMLIDDTTKNQLGGEPGKRPSRFGSARVLPQPSRQGFSHDKTLPRLPRLYFDGEDNEIMGSHPAITATMAVSDKIELGNDTDEPDSFPPPVHRQPSHARKSSAPSLPRKSSKRRSRQREPKVVVEARSITGDESRQNEPRMLSKAARQSLKSPISLSRDTTSAATPKRSPDVSQQIESMLAASQALKLEGDSFVIDSPALSKKSGVKGNRVLSKVRNAITGQLHDREFKKRRNLAKNEHLLDPDLSQLPDYEEETSTISAIELRINEGINFGNPKIQSLTGHGTIRRKPIADDGRSLMSRKSAEILSLEDVRAREAKALTSFDSRRQSNVSFDQSADTISSMPSRSQRFRDEPHRLSSGRKVGSGFEADFDVLFSSSPVAQSTPRIRLEPTFEENGDKKLRNVPANSHSLFDPESSMREPLSDVGINKTPLQLTAPRKLIVKRNNSHGKDVSLGVMSHMSKRRKKHPSPSKAELEGLEDALAHYCPGPVSVEVSMQEELTLSFGEDGTREILKSKDNNAPLSQAAKRGKKGNGLGLFGKSKQAVASSSMMEPARRPALKAPKPSMIPKPAGAPTMKRGAEPRRYQLLTQADESAMDTDELQWNSTAYHIGMRG